MERKGGRIERVKGYKYIEMEGWRSDTHNAEHHLYYYNVCEASLSMNKPGQPVRMLRFIVLLPSYFLYMLIHPLKINKNIFPLLRYFVFFLLKKKVRYVFLRYLPPLQSDGGDFCLSKH